MIECVEFYEGSESSESDYYLDWMESDIEKDEFIIYDDEETFSRYMIQPTFL